MFIPKDRGGYTLHPEIGQPTEPAWHVPILVAQQRHHRRHQDGSDNRSIDQDGDTPPKAHLLQHHEAPCGKAAEHGHYDQGSTGNDLCRLVQSDRYGLPVSSSLVVVGMPMVPNITPASIKRTIQMLNVFPGCLALRRASKAVEK